MLSYPRISAIALELGPLKIYWYGISYFAAFLLAWWLAEVRVRRKGCFWLQERISDLIFYGALGAILGGRLGYLLFYGMAELFNDPWFGIKIWLGGMSFHGGLLGAIVGLAIFARNIQRNVWDLWDFAAPLVPLGLGLGRLGNFINQELWGRFTEMPWGMIFPLDRIGLPRHPSQLYEALGEGVVLFIILWLYSAKPRPRGSISGLFLLGYGVIRGVCEFFREPDPQLGFIGWDQVTMGQLLSIPMILLGIFLLRWSRNQRITT